MVYFQSLQPQTEVEITSVTSTWQGFIVMKQICGAEYEGLKLWVLMILDAWLKLVLFSEVMTPRFITGKSAVN